MLGEQKYYILRIWCRCLAEVSPFHIEVHYLPVMFVFLSVYEVVNVACYLELRQKKYLLELCSAW